MRRSSSKSSYSSVSCCLSFYAVVSVLVYLFVCVLGHVATGLFLHCAATVRFLSTTYRMCTVLTDLSILILLTLPPPFLIFTGNFSDVTKYACKGCQDGYLTESLVAQRHWSYYQLPIDGLKSMVFHGPSPTLCVASGT